MRRSYGDDDEGGNDGNTVDDPARVDGVTPGE